MRSRRKHKDQLKQVKSALAQTEKLLSVAARKAADARRQAEDAIARSRQLVRALKWERPQTDDVEITCAIRIPKDQVMGMHDAERLWAEALAQIGFDLTTRLAKHSMAAVTRALWSNDGQTFVRAKREWVMKSFSQSPRYYGVDPDTLGTAWDAAVAAILATAKDNI